MKIIKNCKKLIITFLAALILLSPTINVMAAEGDAVSTAVSSAVSATIYNISPTAWLISQAVSIAGESTTTDLLQGSIGSISDAIITACANIAKITVIGFLGLAEEVLKIAVSGDYFGFGFTPTDNPYISIGWGIVRNIANAVLVIGLVVIAISIILGRQENQAKKTLINFILIALLINFTPVICGFIIDGSNIITASMMSGGISSSYSTSIGNVFDYITKTSSGKEVMKLAYIIMVSVFCIFAIVIYFLYAILFLARTVILWILVIISPLAFATKVIPQSKYIKKVFPSVLYWDDWWESFVQWCVIGIPAGFSLYLSNKMLIVIGNSMNSATAIAAITDKNILGTLATYLLPFIFLIAGFLITISAGGQVGSFVGGLATGAWAASGGRAIKGATDAAQKGGEWMIKGGERTAAGFAVGGLSGIKEGYNDSGIKGALVGGATGAAMGGIGAEGREKAAKKIAEIKESVGFTKRGEYDAKLSGDVEEAQKRLDSLSDNDLKKIATSGAETRGANIDKSAAFNALNKRGKLDDNEIKYLTGNKKWAETFNVKLKDVAKARPEYAQDLIGKNSFEVVSGMSPAEAGKTIRSKSFADPNVLSSLSKQTMKGKLDKGSAEDIKNIKDGFAGLLQSMNTFSSNTVLPEDLEKLVQNNLVAIEKETQKMIDSGVPEEVRKASTIRGLINAQKQRRI
jgi:hypothetical protein